jgi:hypothetical protein
MRHLKGFMNSYKYSISLRISGDFDAIEVSKTLGLENSRIIKKGDVRGHSVSDGTPLLATESHISKTFYDNIEGDLNNSLIDMFIHIKSRNTEYLALSKELALSGSDGHGIEVFIGLFGDRNFGFEIDPWILKLAGKLNISFSFDIYP